MSKHERQHNLSHVINTSISKPKRARVEDEDINNDEKINFSIENKNSIEFVEFIFKSFSYFFS